MNIVMIAHALQGGGAEKQLLLVCIRLAGLGHRCTVLTLADAVPAPRLRPLVEQARASGVRIEPLARAIHAGGWLAGGADALEDSVVWSWGRRADIFAAALQLLTRRPWIVSLRDADGDRLRRHGLFHRLVDRLAPLYASNTELNLQQLEEVVPGVGRRGCVIRNALDFPPEDGAHDPVPARPARLRIGMLGNLLLHKKGYDLAVAVAARCVEAGLPVEIEIRGVGHEEAQFQALVRERGVAGSIRFGGPTAEPIAFLRQCDAFLLLSRFEGTPNALLEAMSLGLPCVAARVGDLDRFARHGEHLRLFPVGDADAAFAEVRALWEDWAAARALGRAGRALCRATFTPEQVDADLCVLLRRVRTPDHGGQI